MQAGPLLEVGDRMRHLLVAPSWMKCPEALPS